MPKLDLDTPFDELEPSKSELKRQMAERQKLAEALSKLGNDSLKTVPLDEELRDAIAQTSQIRSFEGIRRHKQYLGKLMRALSEDEIALIKKQLDIIEGPGRVETALLHRLERLRERLLESDVALNDLIANHPDMDIQKIRTLIRNARKEKEGNKPPKAQREIFQFLKELNS
jgi:ribosome-associated protein